MLNLQTLSGFQHTSAGATPLPTSLKGIKAWQFFQLHMAHGNTSVSSGGSRGLEEAKALMQWFLSMVTPQEKNILLPLEAVASVGSVVLISKSGNSTDDNLTGTAPGTYQRYLKYMGVTAIVPVQASLLQWRAQHDLLTFDPQQVLQLPDVLIKVNPRWCITTCSKKKQLVLEGFSVLEEWSDSSRVRPWSNAWNADKDSLWLHEYHDRKKKSTGSGQGGAGVGL